MFRMLCRITQSSDAHRTESVSVMDHEHTMGVSSPMLDQKQQLLVIETVNISSVVVINDQVSLP